MAVRWILRCFAIARCPPTSAMALRMASWGVISAGQYRMANKPSRPTNMDGYPSLGDHASMTELGGLIAEYRKAKFPTLEQAAEALEVSRSAVNQWELGLTAPRGKNIAKVIRVFGIDSDDYMAAVQRDAQKSTDRDVV